METIFDHKVTRDELKNLFGIEMSKSEYLDSLEQRKAYEHLYYLYRSRGNRKVARKYLDKTPDDKHKFFEVLNLDCGDNKYFSKGF